MNATALRFVPTALVFAAGAACAWPYLGMLAAAGPSATAGDGKEIPQLSAALLAPTLSPKPGRDPFADPELIRSEARSKIGRALGQWVTAIRLPKKVESSEDLGEKSIKSQAHAAPAVPVDPRDGLTLSATSAHHGKGCAVINGHAYSTGELVRDARSAEPCFVADVLDHRVVLQCRGQAFVLDYPIPTTSAARGPAARAKPLAATLKPAAKAVRSGAKRTGSKARKNGKN